MSILKNPVILALDVDTKEDAMKIMDQVGDLIGGVKIGPRLNYRYGADFIKKIAEIAPVFIDNKYFDITSTMLASVRASFEAGATLVTVHALAGASALKKLSELELELNQIRPFKILAVTILTSWDQASMSASFQSWPIENHVRSLTEEVYNSGLRGLVCSGHELEYINYPDLFKVIPGIRFSTEHAAVQSEDQKRVMTPGQAIKAGASALVIGRPILQAQNPREAILELLESCK